MMHPSRQSDPHPRHLFQRLTGSAWDDCSNKIGEQDDGQRVSLAEELNLYRLLLAQLRSADPVSRSTLSRNLTFLIIREFGLRKLLTATFDFDESSQHVTTLDQRCQAMANLIAAPPVICCPLSQYFQQLSHQIHSLMKHDPTLSTAVTVFVNKLCALTVNSMVTRNRKLTLKTFIHPLISSLSNSGTPLTPQNCIEVVCGLALADFDLNLLLEAFPAILFAQFALEQTSSTQKQPLWLTITELLKRVDNSLYLLDDSLFNHYSTYANLFRVTTNASGTTCIVFRERCADEKINLMTHDHIVSSIMSLISDTFSEETQVDFCLLLLERLSFRHLMSPDCAFLLYALIVTLLERIEPLFCKFPRKWIRFISETLKRMSSDSVSKEVISDPANRGEESEVASAVRVDSIGVVMQILQILVNERSKVDDDDMRAIRGCISTMIKWGNASAIQDDLISLMGELDEDRTVEEKGDLSVCRSENFHNALRDLNDSLMPTRAHGLICLKRLILAGDETVLQNWKRVLQHLEICLSDGESYIYLSAINTLAALCLRKTDQTLPILLQAFENQERTIQERLNVAEVIVRVSRNLQESPKYSQLFFRTFMRSLKDPDEMIRVSTLSKMGHFCSHLGSALEPFVGEIFHTVYSLIRNDESLSVKRASLMMLHLTLTGIDGQLFQMIQKYGSQLHSLMQEAYTNDPDDVSRLHAQLVLEEMDRIAGERIYSLSKSASHHQIK